MKYFKSNIIIFNIVIFLIFFIISNTSANSSSRSIAGGWTCFPNDASIETIAEQFFRTKV